MTFRPARCSSLCRPPFESQAAASPSCRLSISSSSARVPPVRSWRNGCRPAAASRCWCSRRAAATAASSCRCRSATARPSIDPRVNWSYMTEPDPGLAGARSLAARQGARRLELDQRHGLHPRPARATSTAGRRPATPAGALTTCCPHFKAIEDNEAGADAWRGTAGRCTSPTARPRPSADRRYLLAPPGRPGLPRNRDFNGASRKASAIYQITTQGRPPHVGGATPSCGRRCSARNLRVETERWPRGSCSRAGAPSASNRRRRRRN